MPLLAAPITDLTTTTEDGPRALLDRFIRTFKCDTARISNPLGDKMFLIIGWNRNTRQDEGHWEDEHGHRKDWDYVHEECIASGSTEIELVASAEHYKKLVDMTMEDYLRSLFPNLEIP